MKTFQEFLTESMTPSAFIKHHEESIRNHKSKAVGNPHSAHHDAVAAHQIALEAHKIAKKDPQQRANTFIARSKSVKADEASAAANKSTS